MTNDFKEFFININQDQNERVKFLENPVGYLKDNLGIDLTERAAEIEAVRLSILKAVGNTWHNLAVPSPITSPGTWIIVNNVKADKEANPSDDSLIL